MSARSYRVDVAYVAGNAGDTRDDDRAQDRCRQGKEDFVLMQEYARAVASRGLAKPQDPQCLPQIVRDRICTTVKTMRCPKLKEQVCYVPRTYDDPLFVWSATDAKTPGPTPSFESHQALKLVQLGHRSLASCWSQSVRDKRLRALADLTDLDRGQGSMTF